MPDPPFPSIHDRTAICRLGGHGDAVRQAQAHPGASRRALRFSTAVNTACPRTFGDIPSATVWKQLVRAADSASANLLEADDASSTADFLHKMRLALREVKEARQALAKLRLARLQACDQVADLEREAGELSAIFAAIVLKSPGALQGRTDTETETATTLKLST